MPVKTAMPRVEDLPGYQPGMCVPAEVQELMALGDSVLYRPPDDNPKAIAMPAKCAEHPGGVEGWLKDIYVKRDKSRRMELIRKLKRAYLMEAETKISAHAARNQGEPKETPKYSLQDIKDATDLPDLCMAAIATLRGQVWSSAVNAFAYTTLLRKLYTSYEVDWVEDPQAELIEGMVVEEVPREPSREQLSKQIDKALAYQGRCPECGGEPVFIFNERAYCAQAERVHHSHRERHGWDIHEVSPAERKAIEASMAIWRRDPSVRFPHPERVKGIQSPITRVEPVDLDALVASSRQAREEESHPIDVETMPPARLHTEKEPAFLDHMDTELAEELRADPEPHPSWTIEVFERKCRACGCTEEDCSECIAATGEPCSWVDIDLCSRCDPREKEDPGYLEDAGAEEEVTIEPDLPTENTPPVVTPEPSEDSPKQESYIDRLAAVVQDNLQADALQRMQRRLANR